MELGDSSRGGEIHGDPLYRVKNVGVISRLGVCSAKELREGCSSAKTDPSPAGARVLHALAGAKLGGHAEYPGVVEP